MISNLRNKFTHSFITCFPIRRSGALQQTVYGSPPACPVLGFSPPCYSIQQHRVVHILHL